MEGRVVFRRLDDTAAGEEDDAGALPGLRRRGGLPDPEAGLPLPLEDLRDGAAGGGIVKTEANYASLRQNGRIYQLVRDLALLPTEGRPLSQGADLAAMWREREPLYTRFRDTEIDNNGTVEDTAAAIWREFCEHSGT